MRSRTLHQSFAHLTARRVLDMKDKDQEDRQLDCKLTSMGRLAEKGGKQTLAAVLSGFANADGGILLWGADARKDEAQVDRIVDVPGVPEPQAVLGRLLELTAGSTSPSLSNVEHRLLRGRSGPSFIATLVPASLVGPVMAKAGLDNYFTRSGTSFVRMEHFQIADMFARRSAPKVTLDARVVGDRLILAVANVGSVAALAPFLYFRILTAHPRFVLGVTGSGDNMLPYTGSHPDNWHMHTTQADFVLHPESTAWIGALHRGYGSTAAPECRVAYRVGAISAQLEKGEATANLETGKVEVLRA